MSLSRRHINRVRTQFLRPRGKRHWMALHKLEGYWPLDGNANDFSGKGRHGTAAGGVWVTGAFLGGGYEFDSGDSDYINLGFSQNFTEWGFTCFILPYSVVSGEKRIIVNKVSYFATFPTDFPVTLRMDYENGYGVLCLALSKGDDYNHDLFLRIYGLQMNNVFFVGCSYKDGYKASLYCNGLFQEAPWVYTVSTNTRNWYLGRASYPYGGGAGNNGFHGIIDEARMFSRYLEKVDYDTIYGLYA